MIFIISVFICFVHAVNGLFFAERLVDTGFIIFSLVISLLFFGGYTVLHAAWKDIPEKIFVRKLLITALLLRFAAVIALYFFYQYTTGVPFEFNAVDSLFYHERASELARHFRLNDYNADALLGDLSFSDKGYNIYLGIIYSIFGNKIIIARLISAVFSTLTVWLIYKTAKVIFSDAEARIAGLLALLLPNFLLYLGTHLKEPVMIFLVTAVLYHGVQCIQGGKRNFTTFFSLLCCFFFLFMFRTVLAAVLFASFLLYAFLYRPSASRALNIVGVIFFVSSFSLLVINSHIGNEIAEYYEKSNNSLSQNLQFRASRDGGNKYALLAGAPLLFSMAVIAPFPSFVYVPMQDFLWMFAGANLIRNIYAFFVLAAIWELIRRRWRDISFLLAFLAGYFIVLASSGFALSERFQLPVVPVLLILAARGLHTISRRGIRNFEIYLFFITLFVLAWSYVKVSGRL